MTIPTVLDGQAVDDSWGNAVATAINGASQFNTYTPTLAGIAIGTGGSAANVANYQWVGGASSGERGILEVQGRIVFGTTAPTFPTGTVSVTLPTGFAASAWYTGDLCVGDVVYRDASPSAGYAGQLWLISSTQLRMICMATAGSYVSVAAPSTVIPMTWAAGDMITWNATVLAVRT